MKTKDRENLIKDLRKKQVSIQNLIEKQEENDVFDESLYTELDNIDEEINRLENEIE